MSTHTFEPVVLSVGISEVVTDYSTVSMPEQKITTCGGVYTHDSIATLTITSVGTVIEVPTHASLYPRRFFQPQGATSRGLFGAMERGSGYQSALVRYDDSTTIDEKGVNGEGSIDQFSVGSTMYFAFAYITDDPVATYASPAVIVAADAALNDVKTVWQVIGRSAGDATRTAWETLWSGAIPIEEEPTAAETPTITQNLPASGKYIYRQGDAAETLSVSAEVSDGGTLSYQWYKNDAPIDGATGSSYTPPADIEGTETYYCVVTNTVGELTSTIQSESVTVTVTSASLDPTAMILGWLAGKRMAAMRKTDVPVVPDEPDVPDTPDEPSGDPVAYLYNGVQLPDINQVWTDKETYPYALITVGYDSAHTADYYELFLSDQPVTARAYDTGDASYLNNSGATMNYLRFVLNGNAWAEHPTDYNSTLSNGKFISGSGTFLYANYDVLKKDDGTTYLAASEPIPVYE